MTFVSADEPQTRQVVRWMRCMDLVFDGLGLQLLDCCAELSVNFVNALGPLEVKHCQLLDNPVSGVRRHFFDFVTFVYLVPQPAIDLGQMRENRADTARDFRDRVAFFR